MISYLTEYEYSEKTRALEGAHWSSNTVARRWDYHLKAIDILRRLDLRDPQDVLEMGTMGISLVHNSDTMDRMGGWDYAGKSPTYAHDARLLPWPIPDKRYEVFIALRVFQHLTPKQAECMKEARRIARKIILVIPEHYNHPKLTRSRGITYNDFVEMNDGMYPNLYTPTAFGGCYYWDTEDPVLTDPKHESPTRDREPRHRRPK